MAFVFPTTLYLSVVGVSANVRFESKGGHVRSSTTYSLTLRADRETRIMLSTGQPLQEVDVHLTLSSKWGTAASGLDIDLGEDQVGYLVHTGDDSSPHVGGAAVVDEVAILSSLLQPKTWGLVKLHLPSVPFDVGSPPFVWQKARSHRLSIESIEVVAAVRLDSAE